MPEGTRENTNKIPRKMQTQIQELKPYQALIQEATSAPVEILAILERIMREEIFHSTLDWQSRRQFFSAARKAYRMYQKAAGYYDLENEWHKARWQWALAEGALNEAKATGDQKMIAKAQQNYDEKLALYDASYKILSMYHR